MAPEVCFRSAAENYGFDAEINYESIFCWLSAAERMNPRIKYKLALLRTAIDRALRILPSHAAQLKRLGIRHQQ